jgi:hypothetical protein
MKKTAIKMMEATKIANGKATQPMAYLDRTKPWTNPNGEKRFRVNGYVAMPSGLTVKIWHGGRADGTENDVSLVTRWGCRRFCLYLDPSGVLTNRQLVNIAVAFAKRVTKEAK